MHFFAVIRLAVFQYAVSVSLSKIDRLYLSRQSYLFGMHTALLIHLSFMFIGSVSISGPLAAAALVILIAMLTPIILIYAHNIKLLLGDDEKSISCYLGGLSAGLELYGIIGTLAGVDIKGKIMHAIVVLLGLWRMLLETLARVTVFDGIMLGGFCG